MFFKAEVSLWVWILGLAAAGAVVFTVGIDVSQDHISGVGRQMDAQMFSEIVSKVKIACESGEGTSFPFRVSVSENIKAIYAAEYDGSEPPDKVSVLVSKGEKGQGNFLCIKYFDDEEPHCEDVGCTVNMTYMGQRTMDENLASLVGEEMEEENNFDVIIEKQEDDVVYIGGEQAMPIVAEEELCGNGDVDTGEECDGSGHTCDFAFESCTDRSCENCRCVVELDCERCDSDDQVCVDDSDWMKYCFSSSGMECEEDDDGAENEEETDTSDNEGSGDIDDEGQKDEINPDDAHIVIDDDPDPPTENGILYLTSDYPNDAACIQDALDDAEDGDTIVIREGDYQITQQIYQEDKSLNFIGEGEVTLYIHTGSQQGLYFTGSVIKNTGLSANAQKGATQVVLTDASSVLDGDLIKIWKNVQWCPLDYAAQKTGELYLVQSVSGNIVTLNEQLIREYRIADTVSVEISRPIEIHIKNIRVQNVNPTGVYEGLMLRYCKDCSLTESWFNDNGQAAVRVYTGFNVDVKDNEIYNCIHAGNGYGISVAEASAFVTIDGNHIENCRHTIMSGTADFKALNRDIVISNNVLIGGDIADSHVVDSHPNTIDYIVTKNKIYPKPSYNAFQDGTFESVFSENEIYGGRGAVSRRGHVNNGAHIIENNHIENAGYLYGGIGTGVGESLTIRNNYHESNYASNYYGVGLNAESFRNIIIEGNNFVNLGSRGVDIRYHINNVNVEVTDNTFENVRREGAYIDGTSFTSGDVVIKDNIFTDVYPSSPSNTIRTINIQNPEISGNQIS